ncbi:MAG: CHRD domain-containing protein [Cyclobacteriaceae bacterium]|nr:CHRD domain-containing protein [Cyclobacteriaceae bacterium]
MFVFSSCIDEQDDLSGHASNAASEKANPNWGDTQRNFVATISSSEVINNLSDSKARGNATFRLSKDGTQIHYKLIVANIQNVTMAHIHVAPVGINGPVAVWLYPSGPPAQLIPGRSNGILAEGIITESNIAGPFAAAEDKMEALLGAMRAGNTYVNVHTSQVPSGEIRGQIE